MFDGRGHDSFDGQKNEPRISANIGHSLNNKF